MLFVAHSIEPVPLTLLLFGLGTGIYSFVRTLALLGNDKTLPSLKPVLEFNIMLQGGNLAGAAYGVTEALG